MSQGAGEKTEKATPKKRKDARERGQVLKSTEVVVCLSLLILFAVLRLIGPYITQRATALMQWHLGGYSMSPDMTLAAADLPRLLFGVLLDSALMALPMLGAALTIGVLSNVIQVGLLFSTKALQPKFDKLNPLKGIKRMFSARTFYELAKSLLKVTIIVAIVYGQYRRNLAFFPSLTLGALVDVAGAVWGLMMGTASQICMALLAVAAIDFGYQWWQFEKEMKMTKYEVKTEFKQQEGDPQIKNRIRQKQRQMAMMRMMQSVPDADVVITNPTHFAIALKYDAEKSAAPVVLAKGQDLVAKRIKAIAQEHKIDIVENKPLAQALYSLCEIGEEIPLEFYGAVADILAYVYRLHNKV